MGPSSTSRDGSPFLVFPFATPTSLSYGLNFSTPWPPTTLSLPPFHRSARVHSRGTSPLAFPWSRPGSEITTIFFSLTLLSFGASQMGLLPAPLPYAAEESLNSYGARPSYPSEGTDYSPAPSLYGSSHAKDYSNSPLLPSSSSSPNSPPNGPPKKWEDDASWWRRTRRMIMGPIMLLLLGAVSSFPSFEHSMFNV